MHEVLKHLYFILFWSPGRDPITMLQEKGSDDGNQSLLDVNVLGQRGGAVLDVNILEWEFKGWRYEGFPNCEMEVLCSASCGRDEMRKAVEMCWNSWRAIRGAELAVELGTISKGICGAK
eukprot:TRINITY_DN46_c0_g3_i1.p1 TRINITY_DN46_c0_g3~~TRINITY_DN46_c0_g3_i1.p1  ORF type:complete len:120 (+),score=15.90 TRINITY_DN46_c0_g3_i1:157-516(+)